MIYLFQGTDIEKARTKRDAFISALFMKRPDALCVTFDDMSFEKVHCDELLVSQGLFERYVIVSCSRVFENSDAFQFVKERIEDIALSRNVFIFLEKEIPKELEEILIARAEKIWNFDVEEAKKGKQNLYHLADALGERNKKKSWVFLQEALKNGEKPEKIYGILFWQLKNLIRVKNSLENKGGGDDSLGLNPFVIKKTRFFCRNYTSEELKILTGEFVALYHVAHQGKLDLALAMERWLLRLY